MLGYFFVTSAASYSQALTSSFDADHMDHVRVTGPLDGGAAAPPHPTSIILKIMNTLAKILLTDCRDSIFCLLRAFSLDLFGFRWYTLPVGGWLGRIPFLDPLEGTEISQLRTKVTNG